MQSPHAEIFTTASLAIARLNLRLDATASRLAGRRSASHCVVQIYQPSDDDLGVVVIHRLVQRPALRLASREHADATQPVAEGRSDGRARRKPGWQGQGCDAELPQTSGESGRGTRDSLRPD